MSSSSPAASVCPIRLLLVDDQVVARMGTRTLLSTHSDFDVVADASTQAEALRLAHRHRPNIVVTEMVLPDGWGTDLAHALADSPTHVLILSAYKDRPHLEAFLDSPAAGYLHKQDDPSALSDALHHIQEGQGGWFSARVASRLLSLRRSSLPSVTAPASLTPREQSLLAVLATGCSNREIAAKLELSVGTVKNYLTSIYDKLAVDSRTHAVAWAHEHGLVG
jgi:DNA-binding NarL/FixJ family response regulator